MMKQVAVFRSQLRQAIMHDDVLMELFGFRIPRKKRAAKIKLKNPSRFDYRRARKFMRDGFSAHSVEQYFNSRGIRMTRNMLSQMNGARP